MKDLPETYVRCNILLLVTSIRNTNTMGKSGRLENVRRIMNRSFRPDIAATSAAFARCRRGKEIPYLLQNRFFCAPFRFSTLHNIYKSSKNSRGLLWSEPNEPINAFCRCSVLYEKREREKPVRNWLCRCKIWLDGFSLKQILIILLINKAC